MELKETILKRRSIRDYLPEPEPEEALRHVLEAGLIAPTSRNLRPCRIIVVRNRTVLDELAKAKNGAAALKCAPCALIVTGDSERADTWMEDCSVAMTQMMLAAVDEGLGSCWLQICMRRTEDGRSAEEIVRSALKLEEKYRIAGILALGIPKAAKEPYTTADADFNKVEYID